MKKKKETRGGVRIGAGRPAGKTPAMVQLSIYVTTDCLRAADDLAETRDLTRSQAFEFAMIVQRPTFFEE